MRNSFLFLTLTLALAVPTLFGQTTAADYYDRGNDRYKQNDYEGAIADYTKALETNPRDPFIYTDIGDIQYIKKNYETAVLYYTKAIELIPSDASLYRKRAAAYRALNKDDLAEADEKHADKLENR